MPSYARVLIVYGSIKLCYTFAMHITAVDHSRMPPRVTLSCHGTPRRLRTSLSNASTRHSLMPPRVTLSCLRVPHFMLPRVILLRVVDQPEVPVAADWS